MFSLNELYVEVFAYFGLSEANPTFAVLAPLSRTKAELLIL